MDTVIARAKALRKELRLSQREFAERYGIPFLTYAQWERGIRKPDTTSRNYLRVVVGAPGIVTEILRLDERE